jgi:hypothetical protein
VLLKSRLAAYHPVSDMGQGRQSLTQMNLSPPNFTFKAHTTEGLNQYVLSES